VAEDVVEIIANVKGVRFSLKDSDVEVLYLKKKGEGEVKAGDIGLPPNVEVANPDKVIECRDKDRERKGVRPGRGNGNHR